MATTRGKVMLLAAAILLLLGVVLFAVFSGPREPEHQGKKLSEWVVSLNYEQGEHNSDAQEAAIRAIGTNAIPYLLEWMQYEIPPWKIELDDFLERHLKRPLFIDQRMLAEVRSDNAAFAFHILGPKGTTAIPELTRVMKTSSGKNLKHAAYALGEIGKDALPQLIAVITNRQTIAIRARGTVINVVAGMGTNGLAAFPIIIECLKDSDQSVVMSAIVASGRLHQEPDLVVPLLTNFLVDSRMPFRQQTAIALGNYGPEASSAVPLLQNLLNDVHPTVREFTTNALRKIAPEALTNDTGK